MFAELGERRVPGGPGTGGAEMRRKVDGWLEFLNIDDGIIWTLREFVEIITPRMSEIMERVYGHIAARPEAMALFKTPESMARARKLQEIHWVEYVFSGHFDDRYCQAALAIGQAHQRVGVDIMIYCGTYSVVREELFKLIIATFPGDADRQSRFIEAVNRAISLDMGIAASVYYDSVVGAVEEMAFELNMSLARAGEFRDNETGRHILRMSRMCEELALAIGETPRWARLLRIASPLHDVGKIGISDDILLKAGRLTEDELRIMRRHPEIGCEIIPDHPAEVIRMARRVAAAHHERWDGGGYPAGLKGGEIPLEARIAAICDVFDALMSKRPYKAPWPLDKVIDYLKTNRGTHFDPDLVDAFLLILPRVMDIQSKLADEEEGEGGETVSVLRHAAMG